MTTTDRYAAGMPSQSTLDHLNRRYGALASMLADWAGEAYDRYQRVWTSTTPGDVMRHAGREYTVVRIDSTEAVIRWNDTGEQVVVSRTTERRSDHART